MENISEMKVYIVEDDMLLGQILHMQLKKSGFQTELITSGDKASDILKIDAPDLLLLDIFLPGMNGLDLLDQLRKSDSTKELQVVVISNTDQIDSRNRAKELGADFIIKASTTPDAIVEVVKQKLGLV